LISSKDSLFYSGKQTSTFFLLFQIMLQIVFSTTSIETILDLTFGWWLSVLSWVMVHEHAKRETTFILI
jgi:hypothetical protein